MKVYRGPILLLIALMILGLDFGQLWESATSTSYHGDFVSDNALALGSAIVCYFVGSIFLIVDAPTPPSRFLALVGIALGVVTYGVVIGMATNGVFAQGTASIGGLVTGAIGALSTLAATIKSIAEVIKPKPSEPPPPR